MRKTLIVTISAGLFFSLTGIAMAQAVNPIKPLPRDLEIELALSSLPPHLRDDATVYVLDPDRGFKVARDGTNGFHAFVARTSPGASRGSWPYTAYPEDLLVPISFDSAGARANMRPWFDVARLRAEGVPPAVTKRIIKERFETGYYKAPGRAGISYMISPLLRAYANADGSNRILTMNIPHYMFYAPNVSSADVVGSPPSFAYPHVFRPGPHGYIVMLVGEKERADINKEHERMLTRLCGMNQTWCLPNPQGQ